MPGKLALFVVARQDAYELIADIHFRRIRLAGTRANLKVFGAETPAQISLDAFSFFRTQNRLQDQSPQGEPSIAARPGRIIGEFAVPFPYPRVPDLRFEPAFAELSGEVSHVLREAHG